MVGDEDIRRIQLGALQVVIGCGRKAGQQERRHHARRPVPVSYTHLVSRATG